MSADSIEKIADLLPCPWCEPTPGNAPMVVERRARNLGPGRFHYSVRHPRCGGESGHSLTREGAIENWNRRALPSLAELERVLTLSEELCNAVDCAAEDIGGCRPINKILGELGPACYAARAKEAKPSDKCSWCGGPSPCNCTDEDCAP